MGSIYTTHMDGMDVGALRAQVNTTKRLIMLFKLLTCIPSK